MLQLEVRVMEALCLCSVKNIAYEQQRETQSGFSMIPMRGETGLHVQEMQQCMKLKHEGEHGKGSTQM